MAPRLAIAGGLGVPLAAGAELPAVVGVLRCFCRFSIAPRSRSDLERCA